MAPINKAKAAAKLFDYARANGRRIDLCGIDPEWRSEVHTFEDHDFTIFAGETRDGQDVAVTLNGTPIYRGHREPCGRFRTVYSDDNALRKLGSALAIEAARKEGREEELYVRSRAYTLLKAVRA